MNKKVGFYGGKFFPFPHMGHVYAMTVASTMVDELHVIVSYDDDYEKYILSRNSKIPHVDYKQRVRWWSEITRDMPHVTIHAVQETNDGLFESWADGAELIRAAVGDPITHVFSSEHAYTEFFDKLYPDAEHVVIDADRRRYPISGTNLRLNGIYGYNWDMLPKPVQRHYVKRVAIVGTESCGKSTLIKNLATLYQTNYVEEHGRTYYDELGTYETMVEDFEKIAYRQKYFEEEGLKGANRVLFIDTEATVTQRFLYEYHKGERSTIIREIAKEQDYDLILFLEPDVKWVDDGSRVFGKQAQRISGNDLLKGLLQGYGLEYVSISGNYHERLKKAMSHIDEIIC